MVIYYGLSKDILRGKKQDTLRYYDKKGIFFPAKRGIELDNQYRYYSFHDYYLPQLAIVSINLKKWKP